MRITQRMSVFLALPLGGGATTTASGSGRKGRDIGAKPSALTAEGKASPHVALFTFDASSERRRPHAAGGVLAEVLVVGDVDARVVAADERIFRGARRALADEARRRAARRLREHAADARALHHQV